MDKLELAVLEKYGLTKDKYDKLRKELSSASEKEKERFLNQRTDTFTIILNDNELNLFKSAYNIMVKFNCCDDWCLVFIGAIKHDKDLDEKGDLKTVHYHVVIQVNKILRIGTMLNRIVEIFHCNENQVTIDKCNSIVMQTRYLIHLDEIKEEKYPYDSADISTNDKDVLDRYLNLVIIRDLHDLIAFVSRKHYNLEEIMQSIAHYDKWRKYINDLIINHARMTRL